MRQRHKELLIAFFTFVGGLYFFLEYFLPENVGGVQFGKYHQEISKAFQAIGVMAIGLGIGNLVRFHGGRIIHGRTGWIPSLALIFGMTFTFGVELTDFVHTERALSERQQFTTYALFIERVQSDYLANGTDPLPRLDALSRTLASPSQSPESYLTGTPESPKSVTAAESLRERIAQASSRVTELRRRYEVRDTEGIQNSSAELVASFKGIAAVAQELSTARLEATLTQRLSHFLYESFFAPLGSAMFALLAFYIANAAYRSFRIRSLEAGVMMIAALVVMMGQIPFGPLYIYDDLPALRLWLLQNVTTPAFRAIYFGAAVAGLAMATRMWLSLERSPLATEDAPGEKR